MLLLNFLLFVLIGLVTFFIVYFLLRMSLSKQKKKDDISEDWKDF
ncbi:hypothetical protein C426_1720 [Lactococcus garvieae DCC43]|uniref:Uncharacterized protein n=1 Tax=Lactococcus garvieae DCC43 TaxID=1231377 RepID=K2NTR1_9LACT|nr:hypothetical protein C426_1720 [Lactococcus garvieae DCC43]